MITRHRTRFLAAAADVPRLTALLEENPGAARAAIPGGWTGLHGTAR